MRSSIYIGLSYIWLNTPIKIRKDRHKDIGINKFEVEGLNVPDLPSPVTLLIWADDFINVCKLL